MESRGSVEAGQRRPLCSEVVTAETREGWGLWPSGMRVFQEEGTQHVEQSLTLGHIGQGELIQI